MSEGKDNQRLGIDYCVPENVYNVYVYSMVSFSLLFLFFWGGGLHPCHMEIPSLGVESELQTYTTAHSQRWILNPLSEARDRSCVLMDASQIHFCGATTGTPSHF